MSRLLILTIIATILVVAQCPTSTFARPSITTIPDVTTTQIPSLATRLKLQGDGNDSSPNCWDSLIELQACTGEVIMFFLNGETYLGPSCCKAISVIGLQCWPAMFGSIGFTTEEADVLQGFCEARDHPSSPPPPPALPSHPPVDQPSARHVFP